MREGKSALNAVQELHAGNTATCRAWQDLQLPCIKGPAMRHSCALQLKGKRYSRAGYRSLLLFWDYNKRLIVFSQAHNHLPSQEVTAPPREGTTDDQVVWRKVL